MKIVKANSFIKKFKGLMFKNNIEYGMFFSNTNKIHTFFMREYIDIYGLNDDYVVKDICFNVKPWKVVFLKNSKHALEIPSSSNYKLSKNEKVRF